MNDLIPFGASGGPILPARNKMIAGQYLQSPSGQYQLILHEDANLVLKDNGNIIWVATDKQNIVLVDTVPMWSVNKSLWEFSVAKVGFRFESGQALEVAREYIVDGAKLVFQSDGELVTFAADGRRLWGSGTQGKGANTSIMQPDGNFVIAANGQVLWATNTSGNHGSYAQFQSNGNFSIAIERPVWARFGLRQAPKRKLIVWGPWSHTLFKFDCLAVGVILRRPFRSS